LHGSQSDGEQERKVDYRSAGPFAFELLFHDKRTAICLSLYPALADSDLASAHHFVGTVFTEDADYRE
jgi:hypothetical protein